MEVPNTVIAILLIIVILIIYYIFFRSEGFKVKSTIDGQYYNVKFGDKQETADIFAKINKKNILLLKHLEKSRAKETPYNQKNIDILLKRYNPNNLCETVNKPKPNGTTSFNLSKGKQISLCVRNIDMIIHNMNLLFFVNCHELAHLLDTYNHSKQFWINFKWLLGHAVIAGVYRSEDYSEKKKVYCGMEINGSPLYEI